MADRKNKIYLSSEEFVLKIRDAKSVEEVAENIGVDVAYVLRRLKSLKDKNVDVPELSCERPVSKRGRKPLNVGKLNGILDESTKGNDVATLIEKAVNDE